MNIEYLKKVQDVMQKKGYAFFTKGDYNLNLIAIRTGKLSTNKFDDFFLTIYKVKDNWQVLTFPCTTEPGHGPMKNPSNLKGVAIIKPGQYRGCWEIGMHKGTQKALVQKKPITVYRDNNKDLTLNYTKEETGLFGIGVRWSNLKGTSTQVDNWSEGSIVGTGNLRDQWINLLEKSRDLYGNSFTVTLLEKSDFDQLDFLEEEKEDTIDSINEKAAMLSAFKFIQKWEGGPKYTDDPRDPGGPTKYGVALNFNKEILIEMFGKADAQVIKNLTEDNALYIFDKRYWTPSKAIDLPPAIGLYYIDMYFNIGPGNGPRLLQKCLNKFNGNKLSIDGKIGPATINASKKVDQKKFLDQLHKDRIAYYQSRSGWSTYGKGWTNRSNDCLKEALKLIKS